MDVLMDVWDECVRGMHAMNGWMHACDGCVMCDVCDGCNVWDGCMGMNGMDACDGCIYGCVG